MNRAAIRAGVCLLLLAGCASAGKIGAGIPPAAHREEILAVVDAMLLALATSDADAVERLYSSVAVNVIAEPEKGAAVRYRPAAVMVERMRKGEFPKFHERYWDPIVHERGGLAVVWTPYSLDEGGARVHCGVDIFNLSKHDEGWKVDAFSFTMEPTACDEIKPGAASIVRPDFSALDAKEN